MKSWIWMLRKFGVRLTWRYWREGRRRGWMTAAEFAEFVPWLEAQGSTARPGEAESFSGRTPRFGRGDEGSIPSSAAGPEAEGEDG